MRSRAFGICLGFEPLTGNMHPFFSEYGKDICLRNKQEGVPEDPDLERRQPSPLGMATLLLVSVLTHLRTMEKQCLPVASLSGDL